MGKSRDNDADRWNGQTMQHPWHDDHPLTTDDVRRILRADDIELRLSSVTTLGSGWDFNTFLVDEEWVFRFPKRTNRLREFDQEIEALAHLNSEIRPTSIDFPNYAFTVARSVAFPLPYGGYRLLRGTPLLELRHCDIDVDTSAQRLGRFLRAVHACQVLPAPARFIDPFPVYLANFREDLQRVRLAFPKALAAACEQLLNSPYPVCQDRPTFHHADLGPEHLLIDPSTGMLCAIIDWGDVCWGDPLTDFVGWWLWAGDRATAIATDSYGRRLSAEEWGRIRFRGGCVAISQAYYGRASGQHGMFESSLGWLRRIHAAGQLEDIYREESLANAG